jgi:uncharacterized protein YutE (UPF0331/DUF86 family)
VVIDHELVTRKIVLVLRDLTSVQPIAGKALRATPADEVLAERYLERMIGRMIDININYHLLTQAGQPPPADDYASFLQLAGIGVVDHEFARRLAASAGLRNRIVHEYDEMDPQKVYEAPRAATRDIPEYLGRVNEYVRRVAP